MSSEGEQRRGVHLPPSKGRIDSALRDEFQFHLEERVEQFMAAGMTRGQAEVEVRRRFGDVDAWHRMAKAIDEETMRQNRRFELFDTVRRETARSFRVVLRTPASFTPGSVGAPRGRARTPGCWSASGRSTSAPRRLRHAPRARPACHEGCAWAASASSG